MTTRRQFLKAAGAIPLLATLAEAAEPATFDSDAARLRALCERGLTMRYANRPQHCSNGRLAMPVQERLRQELQVIHELDLDEYFMVLWNLGRQAQAHGDNAVVHGPAAGSLVLYGLGLSAVCPLRHDLMFGRFLDRDRPAAPAVTILVPGESQREVVNYARATYGKGIPARYDYRAFSRPWGTGTAGNSDLATIDVLGVPALSAVRKTLQFIRAAAKEALDPATIPEDDPDTLDLFRRGDTQGVFLFGDKEVQDFLRELMPDRIEDIAAAIAVYRRGPGENDTARDFLAARHGRRSGKHPHPAVEEVTRDTHGVLIFQDQVMQLLHRVAGLDLRDGYGLVKALCLRRTAAIDDHRERFSAAARGRGIARRAAGEIFEFVVRTGHTTFCKAHATAQAHLAFQMAFLKAQFPDEFELARSSLEPGSQV